MSIAALLAQAYHERSWPTLIPLPPDSYSIRRWPCISNQHVPQYLTMPCHSDCIDDVRSHGGKDVAMPSSIHGLSIPSFYATTRIPSW